MDRVAYVHPLFADIIRVHFPALVDPEPEDVEPQDGPDYDDPDDLLAGPSEQIPAAHP